MDDQGGKIANRTGNTMESLIRNLIIHHGYVELTPEQKKKFRQDGVLLLDQGSWFVEQIDCERNLYGSRWRLDFYLFHPDKFPNGLVIESKWQGSPGSVDEKYVFTVLSLKSLSTPSMLVLGGGGARRGAVDWIRKQIGKNFKTTDQFIDWGNKNL